VYLPAVASLCIARAVRAIRPAADRQTGSQENAMPSQTIGSVEIRTFPLPPAGFDPLAASADELKRYGFPRRPDHQQIPHEAARWVTAFRRYPRLTHITPEFRPLEHRHDLNKRTAKGTEGEVNATSLNWGGSVLFIGGGDTFTWIAGTWMVPHVYPTPGADGTEYCSVWIGLDGDGSGDVMQAGTETNSDGTCYAWFEWFPAFSIAIPNLPVVPGDVVSLLLCATSSTTAAAIMSNLTAGYYLGFGFSAPPGVALAGNCAEAIVERPGVNGQLAELPRFGEVFFEDTTAFSASGAAYPIGTGTPISMVADNGTTVLTATSFEADTDAIEVTYTGP
jgi:Peptidase A4 family